MGNRESRGDKAMGQQERNSGWGSGVMGVRGYGGDEEGVRRSTASLLIDVKGAG